MHYMRAWPHNGFPGIGGPIAMLIIGLIVVGVLVYLVVAVTRNNSGSSDGGRKGSNAQNILEERYARGEISKEEFQSMRKALRE